MFKKIFFGGLVLVCILVGIFVYNKETYIGEKVDPLTYFDEFEGNTNNLVYEDVRINLNEPVQIVNEKAFVCYTFANQYIDDRIFYDHNEKVLTLTNDREVIRLYEGENQVSFGGVNHTYSIVTLGEELYIEASLLKDIYGVMIERSANERLFVATDNRIDHTAAMVKRKASLQTHAQKKSIVVETIQKGDTVSIYNKEGDYVRVRSENGIIGYLPSRVIGTTSSIKGNVKDEVEAWQGNPLGQTVRLMWDDMSSRSEKDWNDSKYASMKNVNVISPVWFDFADAEGNLSDIASRSYVDNAHNRNMQVWPILRHNFSEPSLTANILLSTQKRQHVISQIIEYAKVYGFDGINIDIENIQNETSAVWVQFMRELYPQLKAENLIVTLDVYMPSNWSGHYEREKVAESCDYFMVMAYDQHWSGSEEAGSVAELPWVESGIQNSLIEVPKEKLVLGIPLYTRLWIESNEGLSSNAYSMASMKDLISSWNITPSIDTNSGQNYIEFTQEGAVYKVWIEDFMSVNKRMNLMKKYDLAGYAAWRLGYETPDIWDILGEVE